MRVRSLADFGFDVLTWRVGMDKMQKSMTTYVKWVGRRTEDREKAFPSGQLGATLIQHGQDYAPESDYGNCLISKLTVFYDLRC